MKYLIALFASVFLLAGHARNIDTKVEAVTIFLNQAEVTRIAEVSIDPNSSELVIGGISTLIDPNSIQVKGTGDFIIMGTSFRRNFLSEENLPDKIVQLKDQVSVLDRKLSGVSNKIQALRAEEELLKANQNIKGDQQNLTVTELQSMAEYYRTRLLAIADDVYDLEKEQQKLKERQQKLKNQLNEEQSREQQVTGEIVITVNSSQTQQVKVMVSYLVPRAHWNPIYDLRAYDGSGQLNLLYGAEVFQETGEDWSDVDLTLSTTNPSVGGAVPELKPWYLDFQRAVQLRGAASFNNQPMSMQAEMADEESAKSITSYTTIKDNLISKSYAIGIPVTIPSGGKKVKVSIREEQLSSDWVYQAAPKIDQQVYLVAKTKGWKDLDLLPGSMNVFYEGGLINKTTIDPKADEFHITLGKVNDIQVERKPMKDLTDDQLIGNKRRIKYQYEILVSNHRAEEATVELFDQLPVSKNADITVEPMELSGATTNKSTGELKWTMNVPAKGKHSLEFGYEVKFPKDQRVPNL